MGIAYVLAQHVDCNKNLLQLVVHKQFSIPYFHSIHRRLTDVRQQKTPPRLREALYNLVTKLHESSLYEHRAPCKLRVPWHFVALAKGNSLGRRRPDSLLSARERGHDLPIPAQWRLTNMRTDSAMIRQPVGHRGSHCDICMPRLRTAMNAHSASCANRSLE